MGEVGAGWVAAPGSLPGNDCPSLTVVPEHSPLQGASCTAIPPWTPEGGKHAFNLVGNTGALLFAELTAFMSSDWLIGKAKPRGSFLKQNPAT